MAYVKLKILVINGPNLNMLGIREPSIYGDRSYAQLVELIESYCRDVGVEVAVYQSNHEGDIVDKIQSAYKNFDALIINPAAYTHTSIAIPDAIKAVGLPAVEVHLSDISSREDYRKISYTSEAVIDTVCGRGFDGYTMAVDILLKVQS